MVRASQVRVIAYKTKELLIKFSSSFYIDKNTFILLLHF